MRGLEISAGPRTPAPRGPSAAARVTWSCVGGAVDRQPGVPSVARVRHLRANASAARYISMAPGRRAELLLVDDDHLCRTPVRPVAVVRGRLQPPLRVLQTFLDALELVAGHQPADEADREHRPHPNHLVGDDVDPATDRGVLPVPPQRRDGQFDQVGCPLDVPGRQRMADRRRRLPVLVVPVAGAAMQVSDLVGSLVEEVGPQHVREQVVVAVPVAAVVERDQEQVGAVQRLQGGLAAGPTGHGVAQRAAQPVQQAGAQQEGADLFGLPLQHLLDQVVDDVPVVAGEAGDEGADVLSSLHREGGELERGDPAFGPSLQRGDVVRRRGPAR